jgi:aminoglycoside 6'-N-acetyltransferase
LTSGDITDLRSTRRPTFSVAIRTYEEVGLRTVGVMREYWRSPEGTWLDGVLMDLLARELDPA